MYTIETDFSQTYIVAIDTLNLFPDIEVFVNEDGTVYLKQVKHMVVNGQRLEVPDVVALSPSQFHMLEESLDKPDGAYPITGGKLYLEELIKRKKQDGEL